MQQALKKATTRGGFIHQIIANVFQISTKEMTKLFKPWEKKTSVTE